MATRCGESGGKNSTLEFLTGLQHELVLGLLVFAGSKKIRYKGLMIRSELMIKLVRFIATQQLQVTTARAT